MFHPRIAEDAMVKVPVPVSEIMSDPDLSLTSSPFSPGNMVIKRASFKAGEVPDPLEGEQISKGECKGLDGKVVYDGKRIPKTAACVAGVPKSELQG